MQLYALQIGVKRTLSRINDPRADDAQAEFERVRGRIMERDRFVCRFCGIHTTPSNGHPSGYFEVHHLDDDHHNNRPDNLVTACPFCHMVFTAGLRGDNLGLRHGGNPTDSAHLLWLPGISQNLLNRLSHVVFQVLRLTAVEVDEHGLDGLRESARQMQEQILDKGSRGIDIVFGRDLQGELMRCHHLYDVLRQLSGPDYAQRQKIDGLRLWPRREVFAEQIDYWKTHAWKSLPPSSWMGLMSGIGRRLREDAERGRSA